MKIFSIITFSLLVSGLYAQILLVPETFDTDVIVHGSSASTSVWFGPDYYTPIDYSSNGGCSGGYAGYQGNWNNYWMNFLRTPAVDCTGLDSVILFLELTNSYDISHTNNKVYFNMWIDGGYEDAVINQTIYFDQVRNCEYVEVVYDLTTYIDKSAILFYLNVQSGYNDSHTFDIKFDNIGIKAKGQIPFVCDPFAGNDTTVCGLCMITETEIHDSNTVVSWSVLSTPSGTASVSFTNSNNPVTDVCVDEPGLYELVLTGQGNNCSGSDTIKILFDEFYVASHLLDTNSFPLMECGLTSYQLLAQTPPAGFTGYWYDETMLTQFFPDSTSPDSTVVSYYGLHNFHWVVVGEYGICSDTTESVPVIFIENPVVDAGADITDCWNTTTLNAFADTYTLGFWLQTTGITFGDIYNPATQIIADSVGIYVLVWHAENGICIKEDTVLVTFEDCTGLQEYTNIQSFHIFTDFVNSKVRIESSNFHKKDVEIEIFSITGRKFFKGKYKQFPVHVDMRKGLSLILIKDGDNIQKQIVFL